MSPQKKLPLKVRYTRAKVRHLASPLLWFPLGIICLLGVFIWELSVNPELLEEELAGENGEIEKELSAAEISAIAADIDSSEFLLQELESNAPVNPPRVVLPKAVLEEYMDENGRTLTLLEKTQKELYSIYEKIGREESTGTFTGENPNNNSLLNLGTTPSLGESSERSSNNRLPNPTPLLPPTFNVFSPENRKENSKNQSNPLEAAMPEALGSGDSSESLENDGKQKSNYNSQLYESQEDLRRDSANFPIDNSPSSSPLPNNPNYSNPGAGVNSNYQPYYIDRSSGYGNTQNQPYYTNGSPTVETPENQPYYNNNYGNNSWQSQPTQLNVPLPVPVEPHNSNLPSNPYSRTGSPYSGNYPYSANQGNPQLQQNQVNNGANYYLQNNGATQQAQPYNNSQSNPFNKRFGAENNPFNNR